MKKCFKCRTEKELSEFYKHKEMADGHLNKCKECTRLDSNKHRKENIEKVKEYDRNRPNKKERSVENRKRLHSNPKAYKAYLDAKNNWSKKNKEKRKAHQKVARALFSGKIKRKFECEKCGSGEKTEAHHSDYEKPLEVIWLCIDCHKEIHKNEREAMRVEHSKLIINGRWQGKQRV